MNEHAQALGRLGGLARAEKLTKKRIVEIASAAGKLGGWPKGKKRGPRKPKPAVAAGKPKVKRKRKTTK